MAEDDDELVAFCSARLVGAVAAPLQAEPPPHPQPAASGCDGR